MRSEETKNNTRGNYVYSKEYIQVTSSAVTCAKLVNQLRDWVFSQLWFLRVYLAELAIYLCRKRCKSAGHGSRAV
jgi:hypothetical protein